MHFSARAGVALPCRSCVVLGVFVAGVEIFCVDAVWWLLTVLFVPVYIRSPAVNSTVRSEFFKNQQPISVGV